MTDRSETTVQLISQKELDGVMALRAQAERWRGERDAYHAATKDWMAEVERLRAGISWVRGLCSDGEPLDVIDAKLGDLLGGEAL